jgi:hypothetical protein
MKNIVKTLSVLGMICVLIGSTGCASSYWANRGNDAMDILDVGVTYSKTPHVAVYAGFQNLLSVGYAEVEGGELGIGQSQFGALPMRYHAGGMSIEGYEQYAFGNRYDPKDPVAPTQRGVGLGMLYHRTPGDAMEFFQCPKFVHLGWIGLNLNCKIGELVDFVFGWTTLDLGGDDDAKREAKYTPLKPVSPAPEKK